MFCHGAAMRIDTSNLILAAQAQTQRPAAAANRPGEARFEALDFPRSPAQENTQKSAPNPRPGAQLDIKV